MRRARRAALGLGRAFTLAITLGITPSAAEEPRFVVDTYDIIGGCPDEAAFRADVERRVHARTKAPMHVVVHVTQQARSIDGSVEIVDAGGAKISRKVTSTKCAEIVAAAALVVALAIDDAAENTPAAKPAPAAPTGDVTPDVAPLTIDTSERRGREIKDTDLVLRFGLQGAVQTGVTPSPVIGLPLFFEIGSEHRYANTAFEPRARVSWTFAASSEATSGSNTASFSWMSARL